MVSDTHSPSSLSLTGGTHPTSPKNWVNLARCPHKAYLVRLITVFALWSCARFRRFFRISRRPRRRCRSRRRGHRSQWLRQGRRRRRRHCCIFTMIAVWRWFSTGKKLKSYLYLYIYVCVYLIQILQVILTAIDVYAVVRRVTAPAGALHSSFWLLAPFFRLPISATYVA